MRPTSPAQYAAYSAKRLPDLDEVREGIFALAVPIPVGRVPYSFSYLVDDGTGAVHIVDCGYDSDEGFAALGRALATIGHGVDDVATVTATHLHNDHLGMALRIRAAAGAQILMHGAEQAAITESSYPVPADIAGWRVPEREVVRLELESSPTPMAPFLADALIADGDVLQVPGRQLRVVHTPGHTRGHVCIVDPEQRLIFSGDHVLPQLYPGVGRGGGGGGNPLRDYFSSLDRMAEFADHEVLPGHGYRFAGLADRVASIAEHGHRRTREVEAVLAVDEHLSVWDVASRLTWSAGWENLSNIFLRSALLQTAMHMELVRDRLIAG